MSWNSYIVLTMLASLVIAMEAVFVTAARPRARLFGLLAIFGIVALPVAVVLHNIFAALTGGEEAVSFIVGTLVAPAAITLGTFGVAAQLRHDAPGLSVGFALAGVGLVVLPAYVVAALVASMTGQTLYAEGWFEQVVLPISIATLTAGAIWTAFAAARDEDRRLAIA